MGKMIAKLSGAVLSALAMTACGTGGTDRWTEATRARHQILRQGNDLLGVTVPVLRSRGLEQVWGAPAIQRDGEGGYCLTYSDPREPSNRLMIHGMATPMPKLSSPPKLADESMRNNTLGGREHEQAWRGTSIADNKVRWFQESSGNGITRARFSTEGFTLKSPDGRTGHYRLAAENRDNAPETVARWFGSASF